MDITQNIMKVLLVNIAVVFGSSVGNELGAFVRDELEARRRRTQGLPEPERRVYLQTLGQNAPATATLAATVLAQRASQRRPLWGFMLGVLLAALISDRFDRVQLRRARPGQRERAFD
jgi:hypothetical protein